MSDALMFDYVIVGAGSAGSVLAHRLSANGQSRVCIVEAGPRDSNPWIHIPVGIPQVIADRKLDWSFWTVPQRGCNDRRIFMPRGKTLGGSSAINAMVAVRGHPLDYDAWAAAGAAGWSYRDVLPYFRRSETFEGIEDPSIDREFHGDSGPLSLARPRYVNPLVTAFIQAAVDAGIPANQDFTGVTSEGVGLFRVFEKNGRRFSNADAYLHTAEHRANLHVMTGVLVERILIENQRAVGIEVKIAGERRSIRASAEVILSAGAIGSPQLLMLSGVGPAAHLRELGISVVVDAPEIGANLQDHLDIHISTVENGHLAMSERPESWGRLAVHFARYLVFHDGEISTNVSQAGAFVKTLPGLSKPDVQWHFCPIVTTADSLDPTLVRKHYGYTLACCGLSPRSRGTIRLSSSDPAAEPLIDPNYLDDPQDLETIVRGLALARAVLDQLPIARHRDHELEPGQAVQSESEWREYIRRRSATTYHPVGTCRMGADDRAPVTARLKVRGVDRLRVIDASVMPLITGGNTNAPTTMIAEKGADLVLAGVRRA